MLDSTISASQCTYCISRLEIRTKDGRNYHAIYSAALKKPCSVSVHRSDVSKKREIIVVHQGLSLSETRKT